jgi:ankyrin repeat protein
MSHLNSSCSALTRRLLLHCRVGDIEAVEDFIAVGKDVNDADDEGRTPLHYAVAKNETKIARALIDAGADLTACDTKQNTALHYAAGYGQLDCVDVLLAAGAPVSAKNHTGKTAADIARLNMKNPVCHDESIMKQLDSSA